MGRTVKKWAVSLVSMSVVVRGFVACTSDDSTAMAPEMDAALRDSTTEDVVGAGDDGSAEAASSMNADAGATINEEAGRSADADATMSPDGRPDAPPEADTEMDTSSDADAHSDNDADGASSPVGLDASDAALDGCVGETCAEATDAGDAALDGDGPSERVIDAAPDSGDSSAAGTNTIGILTTLGADCVNCAQTNLCFGSFQTCDTLGGAADAGPSAGETLRQLCLDTLSCLASTRCAANNFVVDVCYCLDSTQGSTCENSGLCRAAEERGLETTDATEVYTDFNDPSLGGGVANNIVQCLLDNSCSSCFP
jgi:hypothetical protein